MLLTGRQLVLRVDGVVGRSKESLAAASFALSPLTSDKPSGFILTA